MAHIINTETYKIMNHMKNQGINLAHANLKDEALIISYPHVTRNNEKWVVQMDRGGKYFSLTVRQCKDTRFVLSASQNHAGKVVLKTYNRGQHQQWYIEPVKNNAGYLVYIRNKKNGSCLQFTKNNGVLRVAPKSKSPYQWWSFQEVNYKGACMDAGWLSGLTYPSVEVEVEVEDVHKIEIDQIEKEHNDQEQSEKDRLQLILVERKRREAELAEKIKEIAEYKKRIDDLEKALKDRNQASSVIIKIEYEMNLTKKMLELAQREKYLLELILSFRNKDDSDRQIWIIEKTELEKELILKLQLQLEDKSKNYEAEIGALRKKIAELEAEELTRIERAHQAQEDEAKRKADEQRLAQIALISKEKELKERERIILKREQEFRHFVRIVVRPSGSQFLGGIMSFGTGSS